jgi:hypothetical protein
MIDKPSAGITLTRRQAVAALGVGVVAVGGAAAVTGIEATTWAKSQSDQQLQDLQFQIAELGKKRDEAQRQLAAAHLQVQVYQGLVALYETLDKIGIDSIIGSALGAYQGTLHALGGGVQALRAGIVAAEDALNSFENAFAALRRALDDADTAWRNVGALLKNVQELVARATSPILSLVDQATKFFDDLLGKIPFGAGESARQTINGIIGLVVAIPSALDSLEHGLFQTMREGWFSADNAQNLEATLAKPIRSGVLEPARNLLDHVDSTLANWETQVSKPVSAALSQREIVQQQIAAYRSKNGI